MYFLIFSCYIYAVMSVSKTQRLRQYRLVIEKEQPRGKKRAIYNAYCPTLGLADFGSTIDSAVANITKLISFHIESLAELGYPVPDERDTTMVITSVSVPVFSDKLAHA